MHLSYTSSETVRKTTVNKCCYNNVHGQEVRRGEKQQGKNRTGKGIRRCKLQRWEKTKKREESVGSATATVEAG